MADNTRKTSNVIHEVDDLKVQIGNITVNDSDIKLSASKGLTVTQNGDTSTNNDQPTEWKLEADEAYLNANLDFAKPDDVPSVYVKDIKSGDVTTLRVTDDGNGIYTLTVLGSGGGGGPDNIVVAEGNCIKIDTDVITEDGVEKTRLTFNVDEDCLAETFVKDAPEDGNLYGRKDGTWAQVVYPVTSVNGKTGDVTLNANDVGALPNDTPIPPDYGPPPVTSVNGEDGDVVLKLDDVDDVDSSTATSGEVITYNGSSKWRPNGGGNITLGSPPPGGGWLDGTVGKAIEDAIGVSKIIAGTNISITPVEGIGVVTINASGGGGGGIPEAPEDGKQYGREDGTWTEVTSSTPVVPGDGNITLKSTDGSVSVTGDNATANQTGDTAWDLSVNIPTPVTPGDGKIDLTGGTGIDVTGDNATANQTGNTAWSVAIDSTVALKSDIPVIPPAVVPGNGEIKLTGGTGIDIAGANGTANQVGDSDQTISIDSTVALKADIHLPIADEDDTVKIWSAANDFINFDTGGTNDFKMDPDGNFTANGQIISKSVGISNIAFSNADDDGFAFITKDYPGIVSNGEQVQNYNYSALPENPSGEIYQRYQSTIKARKGATSYSELMFLSDDPTNFGLRFLSCGMDVTDVLGWPETCGYDSAGVSAILYTGYEFAEGGRSGEYSPFIIGSINNADVCFIQNGYPFITLDADQNDIYLHVPLHSAEVKNNLLVQGEIQTNNITSKAAADSDASVTLGDQATLTKGDGSEYVVTDAASIATKKYVDDTAGGGESTITFGTPSGDTTPDSPSGSTLHDNLYLYVKGSTVWKKAALYPLDSSGGGSEFPIPQPGQNSGEVWETVRFRSGSNVAVNDAAVSATGNVFFLNNSWSVDGKDWYQVTWNFSGGTTTQSYAIVSEECRIASVGNGVYCGHDGYSYDGQSWNLYNSAFDEAYGSCFFAEGKHWCYGGQYYFDGEGWAESPNKDAISGSIGGKPLVERSDTTIMMINLLAEGGSFSRGPLKRWEGDMETGNWVNQGAGSADLLQSVHGIAWDSNRDLWLFIQSDAAYIQKTSGNFSKSNFDRIDLPTVSDWADVVFDGNRFVAVSDTAGNNVSVWSEDGRNWTISNNLNNPGLVQLAGLNGRVIGAGAVSNQDDVTCIVTGNPVDEGVTTATLPLGTPVDTASVKSVASPLALLQTQADANGYFDEEIKKRALVVTLTQVEYDALSPPDPDTLYLIV